MIVFSAKRFSLCIVAKNFPLFFFLNYTLCWEGLHLGDTTKSFLSPLIAQGSHYKGVQGFKEQRKNCSSESLVLLWWHDLGQSKATFGWTSVIQALTSCGTGNLGVSVLGKPVQCFMQLSFFPSLFLRQKVLLYTLLDARPFVPEEDHVLPQPYGFCT